MTGRRKPKQSANGILDRLASEEANAVLRQLLEKHSELRPEAERIAVGLLSSQSVEDIATANEVLQRLASLPHSEITVTVEIQARVPGGVPDNVVRTVSENCRTLKFKNQRFEQE